MTNKKAVGQAPAVSRLEQDRRKYATEWDTSSANLDEQGCYAWMADQLATTGRVLEIGCGTGRSTLALLRSGNKVICVEENPACIRKTRAVLEAAGYSVSVQLRGDAKVVAGGRIEIDYAKVKSPECDALLIEGNILRDPKLIEFLTANGAFDAVACWLVGTHSSMRVNRCIEPSVSTSQHYRLKVQNVVYEISDTLLRAGGILHVVDRGEPMTTPELEKDLLAAHCDQASVTSLIPFELSQRPYVESEHESATQMVLTPGFGGRMPDLSKGLALHSVRSRKPAEIEAAA